MFSSETIKLKIPQRLVCSITSQILLDPVITSDGHTYEREAIEQWLKTHNTSPKTGEVLRHKELTPNWDKKSDVSDFLSEHPTATEELYLSAGSKLNLCQAIKAKQKSDVEALLNRDPRLLLISLENDYNAFHLSSAFGSAELTAFLIARLEAKGLIDQLPEPPKDFKGPYLNQLLEGALMEESLERAAFLISLAADKTQLEANSGNTLLHRLSLQGRLSSIGYLLEQGANLESKNAAGNTPLLLAVLSKNTVLVDFLLKRKANTEARNLAGESAVSLAVLNQDKGILKLLLAKEIAELPPLHIALALKDQGLLKRLLAQNRLSLESMDLQKRTPFYVAVEKNQTEAALFLLEKGAQFKLKAGVQQLTPLHLAASQGDAMIVGELLKRGVEVDPRTVQEETPLHLAAQAGQDAVIPLLLEAGANRKARNLQNQTPMELAVLKKYPKTFSLIENTAYALKQARLEETKSLKNLVKKQAQQLEQQSHQLEKQVLQLERQAQELESLKLTLAPLKQEIAALRNELSQGLKSTVEKLGQEKTERLQSEEVLNQKILTFHRPLHRPKQSVVVPQAVFAPAIDPQEVTQFLELVAQGWQDRAEAMLKRNSSLVLARGTLNDLAGRKFEGVDPEIAKLGTRVFKDITAFQYALWALDASMWRMLLKYLEQTPGAAREQVLGGRTGAWVQTQGEYAGMHLQRLMQALQTYIDMPYDYDKCSAQWIKQIGGAQLLLPAHVLNEYCHPTRAFEPCPDFSQEIDLPRSRKIKIDKEYDDLLALSWNGSSLGSGFGLVRYSWGEGGGRGWG